MTRSEQRRGKHDPNLICTSFLHELTSLINMNKLKGTEINYMLHYQFGPIHSIVSDIKKLQESPNSLSGIAP
jgi:hypothetical protein